MSEGGTIGIAHLLDLLEEHAASESSPEAEARRLLGGLDRGDELPVSQTNVDALRQIYRRRAARPGADPVVGELARRFDSLRTPEVASVATSLEGRVVYLWLDPDLTSLVGCLVGVDRRTEP